MTKYPIIEWWCAVCDRPVFGQQKNDSCPVCLSKLIPEAT